MVRRSDEVDRFLLSLPIGQALAKQMMIEMAEYVIAKRKKPVPSESTMSIIEWMEKMEEVDQLWPNPNEASFGKRLSKVGLPQAPESDSASSSMIGSLASDARPIGPTESDWDTT